MAGCIATVFQESMSRAASCACTRVMRCGPPRPPDACIRARIRIRAHTRAHAARTSAHGPSAERRARRAACASGGGGRRESVTPRPAVSHGSRARLWWAASRGHTATLATREHVGAACRIWGRRRTRYTPSHLLCRIWGRRRTRYTPSHLLCLIWGRQPAPPPETACVFEMLAAYRLWLLFRPPINTAPIQVR
jgi:hypothetical protein